ncbi:MAG: prepilin-type N-terminal cleavage/methylation domain-containing protein [Deltaproteobacteria bacterium]|nr:prepilin-type N-terminal cleavage/methylation domain-containing protein [Deltaproteobacteria bacterium]
MRTPRRHGFTLMEVMVAVAITALMGTLTLNAFTTAIKAREMVEAEAERHRMVRASMARMVREVGAAFVSDRYDSRRFRDQAERPTNFVGEKEKLSFTSLAHQRLYADAKESDQVVLEYAVETSPDTAARGRKDMVRRANPNLFGEERMDRGGTKDILVEGVKRVEFAYWDSDKKEWDDEWDTRRLERKSILPTRVKITLVLPDEAGKAIPYTTQTRIILNTEMPRF